MYPIERLDRVLGGPARRRVLLLLAGVLGLAGADQAAVGASATQLRSSMHLTHTGLGLIAAVTAFSAALAALPLGSLVDRVNRTRLLSVGVGSWALAMAGCAAAQSFTQLLVTRCVLGAAVAVAAPAASSLIGDFFAPGERGRIWGYVLTGELLGTGFGFTVSGSLASISWRASFLVLCLPALALGLLLRRLPEPARGGPGRIPEGATQLSARSSARLDESDRLEMSAMQASVLSEVEPHEDLVVDDDPSEWSFWHAARYVLRVRTNVYLIVAGSAGYFFFAGAKAFGIEYVKPQYGVGQAVASTITLVLGGFAIVGVLASGWISDRFGVKHHLRGRVVMAAAMLGLATVAFVPALLVSSLGPGILFLGLAAAALAAVNPPVDAGRLDIMHPALWGRAEAVRGLLKQPAEAVAPLLFGLLADNLAGGGHAGLQAAFLIMLAPLAASIFVVLRAARTYPRDVATAAASLQRTGDAAASAASCTDRSATVSAAIQRHVSSTATRPTGSIATIIASPPGESP